MFQKMHMKRTPGHNLHARQRPGLLDDEDEDSTTSSSRQTTTTRPTTTRDDGPSITIPTTSQRSTSTSSSTSERATTTQQRETSSSSSSRSSSSTSSSRTSSSTSQSTTSSSASRTTSSTPTVVTHTVSSSQLLSTSALPASATSTSSSSDSGGISTIGYVGIVGAAIVGAALLVGAIMFVVRRMNKKQNDDFDADEFKDQTAVLNDESYTTPGYGGNARSGPRPPTMFERHNQTVAAFNRPDYGYQQDMGPGQDYAYHNQNPFNDYNSQSPMSYSPGMYNSPMTAAPFLAGAVQSPAYPESPASTMHNLSRSPSSPAPPAMLSRGNSATQNAGGDYADLNRSSVTPYQAAQYEAISRQLNIPVPQPLSRVAEDQESANANTVAHNPVMDDDELTPNPFDEVEDKPARPSSEFYESGQQRDIPESLRPRRGTRVMSKPPSLPEISSQHTFTPMEDSFPMTASPTLPSFEAVPVERSMSPQDMPQLSPVLSSPQVAQVEEVDAAQHKGRETPVQIEYTPAVETEPRTDSKEVVSTAPAVNKATTPAPAKASARPNTVYDDEDAYGGM